MPEQKLTHINQNGEAHMVDVSEKISSTREARAEATVKMELATLEAVMNNQLTKGDVFATARIAGIQAAKKTSELIPLCHALMLSKVEITIEPDLTLQQIRIESYCKLKGLTGVEMEALVAVTTAALTIYDMCKAIQKDIIISEVRLLSKSGGKSGDFNAS